MVDVTLSCPTEVASLGELGIMEGGDDNKLADANIGSDSIKLLESMDSQYSPDKGAVSPTLVIFTSIITN